MKSIAIATILTLTMALPAVAFESDITYCTDEVTTGCVATDLAWCEDVMLHPDPEHCAAVIGEFGQPISEMDPDGVFPQSLSTLITGILEEIFSGFEAAGFESN